MRQDDILKAMDAAIVSDKVPDRIKNQLESLQMSLVQPKRITIMGPPNSAKNDVMSFLAGVQLYNYDLSLGDLHLTHGERHSSTFYFEDGTSVRQEELPVETFKFPGGEPIKTVIEAPVAALKKIALARLIECRSLDEQIEAMTSSVQHSDYVIWCTSDFKGVEQKLWDHMPDRIRDRSIILKTNADSENEDISSLASALRQKTRDEFAFANALDVNVAINSQRSVPTDREAVKRSGGSSLISTVLRELRESQESVLDQVEYLLAKYFVAIEEFANEPTEVELAPLEKAPKPADHAGIGGAETTSKPSDVDDVDKLKKVVAHLSQVPAAEPAVPAGKSTPDVVESKTTSKGMNSLLAAVEQAKESGVREREEFVSDDDELDEFELFWAESELSQAEKNINFKLDDLDSDAMTSEEVSDDSSDSQGSAIAFLKQHALEGNSDTAENMSISEVQEVFVKKIYTIEEIGDGKDVDGFEVSEQILATLQWFADAVDELVDDNDHNFQNMKRVSRDATQHLGEILKYDTDDAVAAEKAIIIASQVKRSLNVSVELV